MATYRIHGWNIINICLHMVSLVGHFVNATAAYCCETSSHKPDQTQSGGGTYRQIPRDRNHDPRDRDHDPRDRDFDPRDRDYGPRDRDFGERDRGYERERDYERDRDFERERDYYDEDRYDRRDSYPRNNWDNFTTRF